MSISVDITLLKMAKMSKNGKNEQKKKIKEVNLYNRTNIYHTYKYIFITDIIVFMKTMTYNMQNYNPYKAYQK